MHRPESLMDPNLGAAQPIGGDHRALGPSRTARAATAGQYLASAEIYDPNSGTFSLTGSMADTLTSHTATPLRDGRVLMAGGYDASADVSSAELSDPQSGVFSPTASGG